MPERRVINGYIVERRDDGSIVTIGPSSEGPRPITVGRPDPTRAAKEGRDQEAADRAARGEGYDRGDRTFDNTKKFRDEFQKLPSVVEFNIALGTYNAAVNAGSTAEGDQSLITSYARMLDPNSVVREGEFATAAGNESAFDQIRTKIAKQFGVEGAGRLTDQGRTRLREEMRNLVVNRFQIPYNRDREQYGNYARMEGLDPYMVVGDSAERAFPAQLLDPPKVTERQSVATDNVTSDKLPQAYQDAHYAYLQQNWGKLTPEGYAAFRSGLDERYGQTPDPRAYRAFPESANAVAAQGGSPADVGAVPSPQRELGMVEGALNSAAQSPTGAFLANSGNAAALGLPAALSGNQSRLEDIRDINPGASFAGELVGGFAGVGATGAGVKAASSALGGRMPTLLSSPAAADALYGTIYGATQDSGDPLRGGAIGALSTLGGSAFGRAIGGAMPDTFASTASREADAGVPTIDQLKELAGQQYRAAEAAGEVAEAQATSELYDNALAILQGEGRVTPKGRLIDTDTPVTRAMALLEDFSGQPMTPTQAQSVRSVMGDGLMSKEATDRRLSGMLIDEFDQWADPVLPGISEARETASRYLQGQEIAQARALAQANSSQFTRSGEENALRNAFRVLERQTIRGKRGFNDVVNQGIADVAEGTTTGNILRNVGKYAPTSPMALMTGGGTLGALTGGLLGGGAGVAVGAGVTGIGALARRGATNTTKRAAEIAELLARGGPEYAALRDEVIRTAKHRGRLFGAAPTAVGSSYINRE